MTNGIEQLLREFDKHESYLNGKIERGIEEYRKGQFVLDFKDKDGTPLSGVQVKVKQVKHEFRFGCNTFYLDQFQDEERRTLYRERFKQVFNYAVVPFYWDTLEPEEGKPRFDKDAPFVSRRPAIDTIMEFCKENGIRAKGHCLVYNAFQPSWISDDSQTLKRQVTKRVKEIAERYGEDIFDFDVINEMIFVYKNAYAGSGVRNMQITDEQSHEKWAFDLCRRYLPNANLYWNEGMFETFGAEYRGFRSYYYLTIQKMLREGVSIDGIGMQYHAFADMQQADKTLKQVCNPLRLLDALERYGDFNLPIHLSEVSIPSFNNETENEELQAALTEKLYKLWFSAKHCEAIVWWNFADGTAYGAENRFHAGLLREDCSIKPAYQAIDRLINSEWNTSFETTADKTLRFSGFYGDYEIEAEYQGRKIKKSLRLHKDNTGYDNTRCDFRAKTILFD